VTQDTVIQLSTEALVLALKISMPFLLAGLVVGLVVSVFQAVTQVQEQTLTFIPKILVMGAVVALGGPWMLNQIVLYTQQLFLEIPTLSGR
jgi:flagellar biosynthesis protein FliQ